MKRIALVTGGNRGIGKSIVMGLASRSQDRVLLGCRNPKSLIESTGGQGEFPKNVIPVKLDLGSREALEKGIESLIKSHPQIDVLVNNAGVLVPGDFLQCSTDDFHYSLQVNALAPYRLIAALLPGMIERGYGRIVNLSSGWGSFNEGLGGPFAYSSTKAFLNALTHTTSRNLPQNVKINAMCPGWVRTEMGGPQATRTPDQGADTAIWLSNLDIDGPTGGFFRDRGKISW